MLEAGAAYISEEWKVAGKPVTRVWALVILFFTVGALSVICAMSQVSGSTLTILGWSVFDFTDMFTSNFILPLGGIAACVLVGWLMERNVVFNELTSDGQFSAKVSGFFFWLARYVCPIIILFMFINGVRSIERPKAAPAEEIAPVVAPVQSTSVLDVAADEMEVVFDPNRMIEVQGENAAE